MNKTYIFDHWEIRGHGGGAWETLSKSQCACFRPYADLDVHAVYKEYNAEPEVSLKTGRKDGADYTFGFISEWWVPRNWDLLSVGIKVADNDRLRYWDNASMGRIAVRSTPLMNYTARLGYLSTTLGGGYKPYAIMEHMMQNWGFSANREGKDFAADVITYSVDKSYYSGLKTVFYEVGKKAKSNWQYVFAYVEARDPNGKRWLYYTDPIQMRFNEWNECNRFVGSHPEADGKCSKVQYAN